MNEGRTCMQIEKQKKKNQTKKQNTTKKDLHND